MECIQVCRRATIKGTGIAGIALTRVHLNEKLFLGLHKWIGDLLAPISWRDKHNKSATGDNQAQEPGSLVALVICRGSAGYSRSGQLVLDVV